MAEVRLSDLVDVKVYQDLSPVNSPEKTAFFQSGVVINDNMLNGLANGPAKTAEMPFWNDLDANQENNYSSDNPASKATPQKANQDEQLARKAFVNQGYSAMDLARELGMGADALQHIKNRFGTYWARQHQRRVIATTRGIFANNVANNDSDMVHDIAADSIANQSAASRWSKDAFVEAAFSMGDMVDGVTSIAMHSGVAKQVTKSNDAEDVRDSEGRLLYQTYLGRRIIIDDQLPAVAGGTDGIKYLSVLFGGASFGWGNGSATVPVEVEREASTGDGGGQETIWERHTWLLHPYGHKNDGTPTKSSFTLAELAMADKWTRVLERKLVPIAGLWTN